MTIGCVKFFNSSKGFGFIIPEGGGNDVFIDREAVRRAGISALEKGQRLTYEIEQDAKGTIKAVKLEKVDLINKPACPSIDDVHRLPLSSGKGPTSTSPRLAGPAPQKGLERRNRNAVTLPQEWQRNYERYSELARNSRDDHVAREGYLQHAEHFYRMMIGSAT